MKSLSLTRGLSHLDFNQIFDNLFYFIFFIRTDIRYKFVLVRAEFEQHRHVKDMRVAKMLLEEGERKLFLNRHPQPKFFTYSPGGVCFERYYEYPDIHLDLWHPLEKARYPFYFAKREIRKKEFIEMWEKGDGKHSKHDSHH